MTFKGKAKVYVVGSSPAVTRMWVEHGYSVITSAGDQNDADILCFIGGMDISPSLYNQKVNKNARVYSSPIDDHRDMTAYKKKTKDQIAIGICRGGQFLNVMSGGSMIQDVRGHASIHDVQDTIWHQTLKVASSHHQMMIPTDEAEIFAYSEGIGTKFTGENGEIDRPRYEPEVIWYDNTRCLCYQGHPEWYPESGTKYFFDIVDLIKDV